MCAFQNFLSRFLSDSPFFGFNSISASIVPSILNVSMLVKANYFPKRDFHCLFYQWPVLPGRGWKGCSSIGPWIMKLWIRKLCIYRIGGIRHQSLWLLCSSFYKFVLPLSPTVFSSQCICISPLFLCDYGRSHWVCLVVGLHMASCSCWASASL